MGVADARDRHFELRSQLERGVDLLDARRQEATDRKVRVAEAQSAGDEFEAVSKRWVRERLPTKSATYRKQIESRLERFVWPTIGAKTLNAVRPLMCWRSSKRAARPRRPPRVCGPSPSRSTTRPSKSCWWK